VYSVDREGHGALGPELMKKFMNWLFRFTSSQRNVDLLAKWCARVATLIAVPVAIVQVIAIREK
jgi:hypothetical protein